MTNTDNIKTFSDLQVYSLNNKRLAPTKKFDNFGPDNDKTWKCDIAFSDVDGLQRSMSATASKKDLAEALCVLKVGKFFAEEKKLAPRDPVNLRKVACLNSINQKLDLILQILDPQALITSHLMNSGDVELNPGPACDLGDRDPLYPEDLANLEELFYSILNSAKLSVESVKDYMCELTYYQTYFFLPLEHVQTMEKCFIHLNNLSQKWNYNWDYKKQELILSGDVEENPGPKQVNKQLKKVDKDVRKLNNNVKKVMNSRPMKRTVGNLKRSFNQSVGKVNRQRNYNLGYIRAVEAVTLPIIDNDFRWPSQFTAEKTGVANVFERPDIGFSKGSALTPDSPFPVTDAYAVLQKIPECAVIVFDQNPAQTPWEYEFSFKAGGNIANPATYATTGLLQLDPEDLTPLKLIQGTVLTAYAPHTNHWYAAQHSDTPSLRYIWMNKHDVFSAIVTNNAATATTFEWAVFVADADGEPVRNELSDSAAIAAGATWLPSYTAGKDGYYAFLFGASQVLNAGFASVKLSGEGYVFCHRAMPSFDTNLAKIDSNRILGASVMATENASVTNMQGKIRIAQVPKDRNWYDFVGKFDEFSGLKGSEKFEAITGVYGFVKPTSSADFEFRSYHSTNGNTITDSFWPIKLDQASSTEKIIVYIRITNNDGQDMYWTFAFAIEYRSNDQFVALDVSSIDVPSANRALEVIKNMQQFHENPLHLSDIVKSMKAGLKSALNYGIKNAPKAAKVIKDYGPTALKLATSLATAL